MPLPPGAVAGEGWHHSANASEPNICRRFAIYGADLILDGETVVASVTCAGVQTVHVEQTENGYHVENLGVSDYAILPNAERVLSTVKQCREFTDAVTAAAAWLDAVQPDVELPPTTNSQPGGHVADNHPPTPARTP